ncbi:MAG TPA: DUF2007 domain-containing protein [Bacteroidaceae bacterium]|nr:DUF2007 domain-containing protein [Bacteroidaceae bacterium]
MKTVYLITLENDIQANILKDVLHNEGIECLIKNEIINSVLPNSPGFQVEVHVLESDLEKAKKIVQEGFPELVGE